MLTSTDDRFALAFEPGDEFGQSGLKPDEYVQIAIMTPAGTVEEISFRVPRTLDGKQSVELK